jgi:hypothetical protein
MLRIALQKRISDQKISQTWGSEIETLFSPGIFRGGFCRVSFVSRDHCLARRKRSAHYIETVFASTTALVAAATGFPLLARFRLPLVK